MIAAERDLATAPAVDLGSNLINGQVVIFGLRFRQWLVLILGEERPFILKLEIHGMLVCRKLVIIESLRPGDDCTLVHRFAIVGVELGRQANVAVHPQTFRT